MTTQELKNNRNEIIAFINKMGYDLKFAMQMAVEICSNCETIDELFAELQQYCHPVKLSGKLAEMSAKAHQDECYDSVKKDWIKHSH